MRRRVQDIPEDLPYASLYADDLEAIEQIGRDEMNEAFEEEKAAREKAPRGGIEQSRANLSVVYGVGRDEMDSISDLLEQGGSITSFTLYIRGQSFFAFGPKFSLNYHGTGSASLYTSDMPESRRWRIYGKVNSVFMRRVGIRNFICNIPGSLIYAALGALFLLSTTDAVAHALGWNIPQLALALPFAALALLVGCVAVFKFFLPNRVHLVRYHDRSKALSEAKRK